jgi:hypothetical protein
MRAGEYRNPRAAADRAVPSLLCRSIGYPEIGSSPPLRRATFGRRPTFSRDLSPARRQTRSCSQCSRGMAPSRRAVGPFLAGTAAGTGTRSTATQGPSPLERRSRATSPAATATMRRASATRGRSEPRRRTPRRRSTPTRTGKCSTWLSAECLRRTTSRPVTSTQRASVLPSKTSCLFRELGRTTLAPAWSPYVTPGLVPSCAPTLNTTATSVATGWCIPNTTCGARCGSISDGCGGTVTCGGCTGTGRKCFYNGSWEYAGTYCSDTYCVSNSCW